MTTDPKDVEIARLVAELAEAEAAAEGAFMILVQTQAERDAALVQVERLGQGVQIKPLVWSSAKSLRGHDHFSDHQYAIRGDQDCVVEWGWRVVASGLSLEAAKAAAQSDYEARIRAALVSPGDGPSDYEKKVAQMKEDFPNGI